MSRISWDSPGEKTFETGVERGVLYLPDGSGGFSNGVPWNGITGVEEDRSSGGSSPYYIDGLKYLDLPAASDFAATLKAYTYPDEFLPFDGVADVGNGLFLDNQVPQTFGLSYRTKVGNDLQSTDYAYKLHVLYNLTATPTNKDYESISASITPIEFSWSIAAGAPQILPGYRPTAHAIFDSRKLNSHLLGAIEDLLYGSDGTTPHIPSLADMLTMMQQWYLYKVTDNGDGTFKIETPYDDILTVNDDGSFDAKEINATYSDPTTYTVSDT